MTETASALDGYRALAAAVMCRAMRDAESTDRGEAMEAIGWWYSDDAAMYCEAFGLCHAKAVEYADRCKEIKFMSEHDEQTAFIDWCKLNERRLPALELLYAVPNAGKRSYGAANYYRAEGLRKGVPDICLPVARNGYNALYIEMKVTGGRLSHEQRQYMAHLQEEGSLAVVAWSCDEAIQILEEYLDNHKA